MPVKPLVTDRLTAWHVLAAFALGALGVIVTWDSWTEIYQYARHDEEASHIFIVLPVSIWMIWVRRMRFRHCRPSGTVIGPLIVSFFILLTNLYVSDYVEHLTIRKRPPHQLEDPAIGLRDWILRVGR